MTHNTKLVTHKLTNIPTRLVNDFGKFPLALCWSTLYTVSDQTQEITNIIADPTATLLAFPNYTTPSLFNCPKHNNTTLLFSLFLSDTKQKLHFISFISSNPSLIQTHSLSLNRESSLTTLLNFTNNG